MDKKIGFLISCLFGFALIFFGFLVYGSIMWFFGALLFFISLTFLLIWGMNLLEANRNSLQRIADNLESIRLSLNTQQNCRELKKE